MRGILSVLAICLVTWTAPGMAMVPAGTANVELSEVREMIEAGQREEAIQKLWKYVEANPEDADGFNLLGYGYRKNEQFDLSQKAYYRALNIDPEHRQAHEYLGELYLQTDQSAKADDLLIALERICGLEGCKEYDELKEAITDYEKAKK